MDDTGISDATQVVATAVTLAGKGATAGQLTDAVWRVLDLVEGTAGLMTALAVNEGDYHRFTVRAAAVFAGEGAGGMKEVRWSEVEGGREGERSASVNFSNALMRDAWFTARRLDGAPALLTIGYERNDGWKDPTTGVSPAFFRRCLRVVPLQQERAEQPQRTERQAQRAPEPAQAPGLDWQQVRSNALALRDAGHHDAVDEIRGIVNGRDFANLPQDDLARIVRITNSRSGAPAAPPPPVEKPSPPAEPRPKATAQVLRRAALAVMVQEAAKADRVELVACVEDLLDGRQFNELTDLELDEVEEWLEADRAEAAKAQERPPVPAPPPVDPLADLRAEVVALTAELQVFADSGDNLAAAALGPILDRDASKASKAMLQTMKKLLTTSLAESASRAAEPAIDPFGSLPADSREFDPERWQTWWTAAEFVAAAEALLGMSEEGFVGWLSATYDLTVAQLDAASPEDADGVHLGMLAERTSVAA